MRSEKIDTKQVLSVVERYSSMLDVSIDKRALKSTISMGDMVPYDSSLWTQEVTVNMKDIFCQ